MVLIPTNAIILAAGESSRMGSPKMLLLCNDGQTFIEKCINAFEAFGCEQIILVLNPDNATLLQQKGITVPNSCTIAINPHSEDGRFSSIQVGIKALHNSNAVFLHNVDNPFVHPTLLAALVQDFTADFIHPVFEGRGGHPILISPAIVKQIIAAPDNQDFKAIINVFQKQTIAVDDPKIIANINTPEAYQFWLGRKL